MIRHKSALVLMLLSCAFLAVACAEAPAQEITGGGGDFTQGSFGYRFDSDQQVDRGRDDDLATSPGTDLGEEDPPDNEARSDILAEPTPPSQTPASPSADQPELQFPQEELVPGFTPLPYPDEWLTPPPQRGFFESGVRVMIMLALAVMGVIALIGVLRNW